MVISVNVISSLPAIFVILQQLSVITFALFNHSLYLQKLNVLKQILKISEVVPTIAL